MKSTWLVAFGVAIALTAGCSSDPSRPAVTQPTTSGAQGTASVDGPDTRSESDISGEWVVLREVTSDSGVFGSDQYAELRQWNVTCNDAACADLEIAASIQGQQPSDPAPAAFDGKHLSLVTNSDYQCFIEPENGYSGPPVVKATETNELDVAVTDEAGRPTVLTGAYTYSDVLDPTAEAAGCSMSVNGTVMDMVLVRSGHAQPAPISAVAGIVRGGANVTNIDGPDLPDTMRGPSELGSTEYAILPCDDDSCEYMIRIAVGDGVQDIPLTGEPESGYSGSFSATADCIDETTGAVAVVDGFATTTNVTLGAYHGADSAFMLMQIVVASTPRGEGLDNPDACYANTITYAFGGRVVSDPMFFNASGELLAS